MEQKIEQEQTEVSQPQLQGAGTPFYQPTIMPSEKADLYTKIDPQDVVTQLKFKLMGMEKDAGTGDWYKPEWSTGLSEKGATAITTLMISVSSKNVLISKLTDEEIRERTKYITRQAIKMCCANWKDYGYLKADQIGFIKEIVLSNTFITLKQPENAGAREFLGKSSSENKQIMEDSTQKSSFLGLFRK